MWLVAMVSSKLSLLYWRLVSLKLAQIPALLTSTDSCLPVARKSSTNFLTDSRSARSSCTQTYAVSQLLLVYSLRLPTKEWPCSVDLYCRYIHNQESLPTQVLTVPVSINVVDQQRPMLPPDQPATNLLYLLTSAENNKKPSCRYRRPTDLLI